MQVRRQSPTTNSKGYAIAAPTDMPQNILEKIVWHKEQEVAQMYATEPLESIKAKLTSISPPQDFYGSLQNSRSKPALIAEVKKASPSKGVFRADFDPVAIATAYERGGASCLSVLTDREFFQGGFKNLQLVRQAVELPLLCKEFIIDPYQIYLGRSHGADAVLLIAAILTDAELTELQALIHQLGMTALIEVHTQAELERVLQIPDVRLIGINNRNLTTFEVDLETTERLSEEVPEGIILVSESGLKTNADARRVFDCGCNAILVGEALMRTGDVGAQVAELLAVL